MSRFVKSIIWLLALSGTATGGVKQHEDHSKAVRRTVSEQEHIECSHEVALDLALEEYFASTGSGIKECPVMIDKTETEICATCADKTETPKVIAASMIDSKILGFGIAFCVDRKSKEIFRIDNSNGSPKKTPIRIRFLLDWFDKLGVKDESATEFIKSYRELVEKYEKLRLDNIVQQLNSELTSNPSDKEKIKTMELRLAVVDARNDLEAAIRSIKKIGLFNEPSSIQKVLEKAAELSKERANQESKLKTLSETSTLAQVFEDSKPESIVPCGMTFREAAAIEFYGGYYGDINGSLRTASGLDATEKVIVTITNQALRSLANYIGPVRRGMDSYSGMEIEHKEGEIVKYKAYTSTSTRDGFARQVRFVILSKTGKYLDELTGLAEHEVLFLPDSQFKVLKVISSKELLEEGLKFEYVMEQVTDGEAKSLNVQSLLKSTPVPEPSPAVAPAPTLSVPGSPSVSPSTTLEPVE